MEVHSHSHTERKKWTHYLWEFLMLFLAVFCGFLAEYQLEHMIEKERGHNYIQSFYEDLKKDTASFNGYIKTYEIKLNELGKAEACYDSLSSKRNANNTCIEDLMNSAYGFPDLLTEDRTLIQLKNAGGLRLIKKADADSILSYDRMIRDYVKRETVGFQELQTKLRDVIFLLTNYANIKLSAKPGSVPFLSTDNADLINRFFVMTHYYRRATYILKYLLEELKQKATSLLDYFQHKYHFKE